MPCTMACAVWEGSRDRAGRWLEQQCAEVRVNGRAVEKEDWGWQSIINHFHGLK